MKIALPLMGKFLSIMVWFSTITLLVACPNVNSGGGFSLGETFGRASIMDDGKSELRQIFPKKMLV